MTNNKVWFCLSIVLIVLLGLTAGSLADVRLPAVLSDNMVLQQDTDVRIWGWAEADEKVSVKGSWQRFNVSTKAGQDGEWMVKVKTPKAGGPFELKVLGNNTIILKNVMVGEVWVASGQSNMNLSVRGSANPEVEIAAANFPQIRLFDVDKRSSQESQKDCGGRWKVCGSETVGNFSAAAYYFGREIHKELDIPVGLIHASWGGTPIEAWMSREALESDSDFEPILRRYEEGVANYPQAMEEYKKKRAEWDQIIKEAKATGKTAPWPLEKPMHAKHHKAPSGPYNAMIRPLMPFRIRGIIWYQGEANTWRAYQYRELFPEMIRSWRREWGQGEFPFYYVQIAPLESHEGLFAYEPLTAAELREAQLMTLSVPNMGMVVTTDIADLHDGHAKNKQEVGRRLALWALAKIYGRKGIVYSGPIYKSMKVEGDKIRLFFDHIGGGLVAKGDELTHFTVAGKDRKFIEARAVIDGNTVVVASDKVNQPVAVRFGWSNDAVPNLFNKEGLPASPFRTDNWPGVTIHKR